MATQQRKARLPIVHILLRAALAFGVAVVALFVYLVATGPEPAAPDDLIGVWRTVQGGDDVAFGFGPGDTLIVWQDRRRVVGTYHIVAADQIEASVDGEPLLMRFLQSGDTLRYWIDERPFIAIRLRPGRDRS